MGLWHATAFMVAELPMRSTMVKHFILGMNLSVEHGAHDGDRAVGAAATVHERTAHRVLKAGDHAVSFNEGDAEGIRGGL